MSLTCKEQILSTSKGWRPVHTLIRYRFTSPEMSWKGKNAPPMPLCPRIVHGERFLTTHHIQESIWIFLVVAKLPSMLHQREISPLAMHRKQIEPPRQGKGPVPSECQRPEHVFLNTSQDQLFAFWSVREPKISSHGKTKAQACLHWDNFVFLQSTGSERKLLCKACRPDNSFTIDEVTARAMYRSREEAPIRGPRLEPQSWPSDQPCAH